MVLKYCVCKSVGDQCEEGSGGIYQDMEGKVFFAHHADNHLILLSKEGYLSTQDVLNYREGTDIQEELSYVFNHCVLNHPTVTPRLVSDDFLSKLMEGVHFMTKIEVDGINKWTLSRSLLE